MAIRGFGSDNFSGVLPEVFKALKEAAYGHQHSYGDDDFTQKAVEDFKDLLGKDIDVYFVYNGTGANILSLSTFTHSYNAVICAETAHINVDECGAPARMTGCALVTIPASDGKLTPALIKPHLHNFGVCHHSQPKAVYISQVSELGTIYTVDEVKAIADLLHAHDMYLHMDGARLGNACAYLGCSMKEVTVDAGVDILSFGGTKNGMMMGEAVVSFRPEITDNLQYYRKQSAQLASKLRYLSCQFIPYLENDLWLDNAKRANNSALRLAEALKKYPQIRFTQKIESNQLFFTIPAEPLKKLQEKYFFYMWNEISHEARLVTSWDTTDEDVADIEQTLQEIFTF